MIINKESYKRINKNVLIIKIIQHTIILILSFLIIINQIAGLKFSELMINPIGSDSGKEWIELKNNETINLSNYVLFEDNINHRIKFHSEISVNNKNNSFGEIFYIICSDCDRFLENNLDKIQKVYGNISIKNTSETEIINISINTTKNNLVVFENDYFLQKIIIYESSFSLSNTGEYIDIRSDSIVFDVLNYTNNCSESFSLEFNDSNNLWRCSITINGTPGFEDTINNYDYEIKHNSTDNNIVNDTLKNNELDNLFTKNNSESLNESENYKNNESYEKINTEIIDRSLENQTNNNEVNDLSNIINKDDFENLIDDKINISSCNVSLEIILKNPKEFYIDKETIRFSNKVTNLKNFSAEYWVEDLFGNIIKDKVVTNNQNEKSFTPKISENYLVAKIISRIIDETCNDKEIITYKTIIIKKEVFKDYSKIKDYEECSKELKDCKAEADKQKTYEKISESKISNNNEQNNSIINNTRIIKKNKSEFELYFEIYKGNTQKELLTITINNYSNKENRKILSLNILNKHSKNVVRLDLLKNELSCDSQIKITGLDLDEKILLKESEIMIDECKIDKTENQTVLESLANITQDSSQRQIDIISENVNIQKQNVSKEKNPITGNIIYESPNYKNRFYSTIGIIITIVLILTYLILNDRFIKKNKLF